MDMSQYKDEFISEAKDHLDNLNEGLLILEKDSADMDNINKLFRAFHTLKGNAATLGYIKFSELAHALEDVLSKIRDNELKVTKEVMDPIFEGADILDEGLEEISNDNPENIDAEDLINELKEILGKKEETSSVEIEDVISLSDEEKGICENYKKEGYNLFRIVIILDRDNPLKNAKAMVILRDLSKSGKIIKTNPSNEDIKAGKFDNEIDISLAIKKSKEEVESEINRVSGLSHVIVLGIDEKYEKPKEAEHIEKELEKEAIAKQHKTQVLKQVQSVKVDMKRLDKLMNLVGELLISNIRLQDINKKRDFASLRTVLAGVDRLILDLQDEVMEIRMVPIGNIFKRFPRMVRDLSNKEGKKVNFIIEGQEIEFDRTVLDEIGDPIVHLLRNSVDHGIEKAVDRINLGKSEEGIIKLIARREKNHAIIEVIDDGEGIDPQKVKESCIRKGTLTEEEASKMSDNDLQMLIFRAGVSTNKKVTDVSGRGVGMDVVLSKIKDLGGNVILKSEPGKGTKITMQLPLTVAIITALLVKANEEIYAIPLSSVDQTVDVDSSEMKTIQGNEVFVLRGKEVPILWLHSLMGHNNFEKKKKATVVIVNKENEQIGLVVDDILSQQQVLIKSLQELVRGTKGIAGATILGDGNVALILDIGSLFD